jgi:RimJ/RimL family protein N-acetyltransferase
MNLTYDLLTESELEWARELHNDPEVLSMLGDPTVVSSEQQKVWFNKLQLSSSSQRLVVKDGANLIGLVRIDQLDQSNGSVCIGLDICKEFRGKGFARQIYRDMFRLFFIDKSFNRIWLLTAEFNARALHLYLSLGFSIEGIQREALYRDGKYHNCIYMSLLRNEYEVPSV